MKFSQVLMLLLLSAGCFAEEGKSQVASPLEPIPTIEKLKAAEVEIRQIFKDDLKKSTPAEQSKLAANFLEQAKGTADDTAARYKLLDLSLGLYTQCGDIEGALRTIQQLGETYQVDASKLKLAALGEISKTAKSKEQFLLLAQSYVRFADEALAAEDYTIALLAYASTQPHARSGQDVPLFTTIEKRIVDANSRKAEFDKIKSAKARLVEKADDHESNLIVGKYYCIVKANWDTGLPLLAKAGDGKWAIAAAADLTSPTDPAGQADAGNKWYDLAVDLSKGEQVAVRARAAYWYQKVLPLLTGLTHIKIEKRLQEIHPTSVKSAPADEPLSQLEVSEATKKVLPTQDELAELEKRFKDVKNTGDGPAGSAANTLMWDIVKRFTEDDPTSWTEADWKAREAAVQSISDIHKRATNSNISTNLWKKWDLWACAAKNQADFLQRMKFGLTYKARVQNADRFRQSVFKYVTANPTLYPTIQSKVLFCEWLKQNGIVEASIEDFKKDLEADAKKERATSPSGAAVGQPDLVGLYNVYDSGLMIGTMELFKDGGIKNWKGWHKPEYRWSVTGDTLTLQWSGTRDTFKVTADGKGTGTSPDMKNMTIEKKK